MDLPSWWDRQKQDQNRRSKKQEEQHAKRVGGKRQVGSGSSWRSPGDVRSEEYLDELKYTDAKSFSVSPVLWAGIKKKAALTGRTPRLIIRFDSSGLELIVTEGNDG